MVLSLLPKRPSWSSIRASRRSSGPNGCGKSNIVDALRWAMGEQSARHLRGHQMEDVVFAGSDSLPPTGMAEVSITFDNEDGRGPAEYSNFSEIMVTRRLFRSGESEYAINKTTCRLKDVIELFLGTRRRQQGLFDRRARQGRRVGQLQAGRAARPDRRSGRHQQVQEPQNRRREKTRTHPAKSPARHRHRARDRAADPLHGVASQEGRTLSRLADPS